jgi:hypothetical protein
LSPFDSINKNHINKILTKVILQTYTELIKNLTIADRKNIKQNQNESPNIYIKIKMILNIQISKDTWKT